MSEDKGALRGKRVHRLRGKTKEFGAAVVWLCSDAAAFVTGHAMVIDGDQTM